MFWDDKDKHIPDPIYPIPHDGKSAFVTVAGSSATEGLKSGGKGFLGGLGTVAIIGGALAAIGATAVLFPGLLPAITIASESSLTLGFIGTGALKVLGVVTAGVIGAVASAATLGVPIGSFTGILSGIMGMFKGHEKGTKQVNAERGAAMQVQSELTAAALQTQAMTAQAMAMAPRCAPHAYAGLPAQGSPMNMASSKINAADIAEHGRLADMQLERA